MKTQTLSLADCYRILGLEQGASLDDVKHAYRKRAFELHPDLNPEAGASRKFQQLNEAYVILIRLLDKQAAGGSSKAAHDAGRQAYAEQARQDRERRQADERARRERQEQERQEREAQLRREQERRLREEREKREAERRERLQREIERQEKERLARKAEAEQNRERQRQAREQAEKERERQLRQQGARAEAYRRAYAKRQGASASGASPVGNAGAAQGSSATVGQAATSRATDSAASQTQETAEREQLLNDLLNDPFARRVYEDIYSEVQNRKNTPAEPPKPRKLHVDWGGRSFSLDLTGGLGHAVKGWLRDQIDEEQELFFPAAQLFPGARIRLQIRRAFSSDPITVDITLPADFAVGKPLRLKGMGKKVGRWQGDLYLTFQTKE